MAKRSSGDGPDSVQGGWTRRRVVRGIGGLATVPLAASLAGASAAEPERRSNPAPGRKQRVVVVGAGAFGGWTALGLLRRGFDVVLVDAWGPGNSRASSGGDTRVIRGMYGPDQIYTDWVVRSFARWREESERWGQHLYHPTGALWMFRGDDGYARSSLPYLERAGLPVAELTPRQAAGRWPHVSFDGVRAVYFEEQAGYLRARDACRAVADAVRGEGGELLLARARPGRTAGARLDSVDLAGGDRLQGEHFVFACGPWLGEIFPDVLGDAIRPTRQEVFFFGTPASPSPWQEGAMPTWIDFGERIFYGVPGNLHRGFKVADDTHGERVDPTTQERRASDAGLARARTLLAERFPGLARAPLLEARVCQYENSPDGHYVIDRHPELGNVWLVGGGSGHGYKLGPAVGEHAADLVAGAAEPLERFGLARLAKLETAEEKSQLLSG